MGYRNSVLTDFHCIQKERVIMLEEPWRLITCFWSWAARIQQPTECEEFIVHM